MTTLRILALIFAPMFMSLQGGQYQKPDLLQPAEKPIFTSISATILGDHWYGFYLNNKKNVSVVREITQSARHDGEDVYFMQDVNEMHMPPTSYTATNTAYVDVDFSLISLGYEYYEKDASTGNEKRRRASCQALKKSVVNCDYWDSDSSATETVTFKTDNGEPVYYDGSIDRMELAIDWKPAARLSIHYIDMDQKKLKQLIITPRGRGKIDAAGKQVDTLQLYHYNPDDKFEATISVAGGKMYFMKWNDGDIEIDGYPAENEQKARTERVKFAADVPPPERTPTQVVVALIAAVAESDTDKTMACFDLEAMYEKAKKDMPDAQLPEFETWKKAFMKYFKDTPPDMPREEGVSPQEMSMFVETMGDDMFAQKIDGDTATVNFGGKAGAENSKVYLHKTADGWKIYWIDALSNVIQGNGDDGGE